MISGRRKSTRLLHGGMCHPSLSLYLSFFASVVRWQMIHSNSKKSNPLSRWTTVIVGLPILMYTSYILYERREFSMLGQFQPSFDCTYANLFPFSLCWQESQAAWRCAGTEGLIHFSLLLILLIAESYVRSEQKLVLERFTAVYKKSGPVSSHLYPKQ